MTMGKMGLLINYDYCTGCHACEVACKQEHGYPAGISGIIVKDFTHNTADGVQVDFFPFPTELCDLCAARTRGGEKPACVKHCMTACMFHGDIGELAKQMQDLPRSALFLPR
jgi:Fe-S-cluster-containing dehydrogenase component